MTRVYLWRQDLAVHVRFISINDDEKGDGLVDAHMKMIDDLGNVHKFDVY